MTVTADSVVVDLIANVDKADANVKRYARDFDASMSAIETSSARAENAIVRQGNRAVEVSGKIANAQRNLGRQIADVGAQLAGGQSPFLIIAQQAPQVADALADTGGKAARVAAFFSGPWGAAILAAASVLGTTLIPKLLDTGDEAERALPKLSRMQEVLAKIAGISTQEVAIKIDLTQLDREIARVEGLISETGASRSLGPRLDALKEQRAERQQQLAEERAATKIENDAREAEQKRDEAKRKADQAAREAASAAKRNAEELQRKLVALEGAYDPIAASARKYADVLRDINSLERAGKITSGEATTLRTAAQLKRLKDNEASDATRNSEADAAIEAIRNRPGGIADAVARSDEQMAKGREAAVAAQRHATEKLYDDEASQIRNLANIYEDAFLGGTGSIWQSFEREGLRVLALLLAKFTILQSTKGGSIGGNLSAAFSSVVGSVFGGARASGGFVQGGMAYRVNEGAAPGRVEGFRPLGSGHIIPLGQMNAARPGGGVTIAPHISIDARGATDPAQIERIARAATAQGIAEAAPLLVSAANGQTMRNIQRPRLPGSLG